MNTQSEELHNWLKAIDQNRAHRIYEWLTDNLQAPCFEATRSFLEDLKRNRELHLSILTRNFSACKAVEYVGSTASKVAGSGLPLGDPGMVFNASAMFNLLVQAYEFEQAPSGTLAAIDEAHSSTLRKFLNLCIEQVDGVCRFLLHIEEFFGTLALGRSRILLVDLPVGNSLAVKLLKNLLASKYSVEVIRISLSRNDASTKGITRRELLERRLREARISNNDIVVYLDEWNTGVNFNKVAGLLRKLVPENAFLIAAAMLSDNASEDVRYQEFCANHDAMMKRWGTNGSQFRKLLPPIKSLLGKQGYFFWSENDRMSGFRKMQIHGSIFSSFDEAIERLRKDDKVLVATLKIQLAEIAQEHELPNSGAGALSTLRKMFYKAYDAYQKCRKDLEKCADEFAAGGEADDLEIALSEVIRAQEQVAGQQPAKFAFILAHTYMQRLGPLDPADRYHFKEHAPTLAQLEGRGAKAHEVTLDFIADRMRSLTRHA